MRALQRGVHVRRNGIRRAQVKNRTETVHVMITEGVRKNWDLWAVK